MKPVRGSLHKLIGQAKFEGSEPGTFRACRQLCALAQIPCRCFHDSRGLCEEFGNGQSLLRAVTQQ